MLSVFDIVAYIMEVDLAYVITLAQISIFFNLDTLLLLVNISDKTKRQIGCHHTSGNHRWIKTIEQGIRHVIQGRGVCFIQRWLHLWRASGGLVEQIDGYYEGKHTVMKLYIIKIIDHCYVDLLKLVHIALF